MARRSYRRDSDERRERTFVSRLVSLLMLIVTILASLSFIISFVAPYIDPSHSWIFPLFGLMTPAIYIFNIALALFFIVRWKLLYALPLVLLLMLGMGRISLFLKIPMAKDYELVSDRGSIKVMSYNLRGLVDERGRKATDRIAEYIKHERPDIICLQEYYPGNRGANGSLPEQLVGYSVATYGINSIYSRYKILDKGDLFERADSLNGRSMFVDLLIGQDTLRVINNHLNSNSIEKKDKAYLNSPDEVLRDKERRQRLGSIVRKFSNASSERKAQVMVIREKMDSTPYRYIVCGDFNDAPISYTYFELARDMKDTFEECGVGYPYTYQGFFNLLRIDYILLSEGLAPLSHSVNREERVSDHLPVVARMKFIR